jgi:hypothetical protein
MSAQALDELGDAMLARMAELRASRTKQLRVTIRGAVLRAL